MRPRHRIMIVDDDEMNIEILEDILGDAYDLTSAVSGAEALAKFSRFLPDLVLLDIMMPGMDGYEVCRRIRADERYNYVKIILVSGKSETEDRIRGYEAGADDYVTKPYRSEELIAKIQVFLRLKRAEDVDRIKKEVLMLFSHETRTPLHGIIGIAEILKEEPGLGKESKEMVELILEHSIELLEFVQKATLLCDLKSDYSFSPENGCIYRHIRKCLQKAGKKAMAKGIQMVGPENGKNLAVCADWKLMDMVMDALLDNAIRFSPENAVVEIRVHTSDTVCEIVFLDQGPGFDENRMDMVFHELEMMHVLHHQKGPALSLSIARYALLIHGGEILVRNRAAKGAQVHIRLPVQGALVHA